MDMSVVTLCDIPDHHKARDHPHNYHRYSWCQSGNHIFHHAINECLKHGMYLEQLDEKQMP